MDNLTQRLRMTTASNAANMPTTVRDDCHAAADRIATLEAQLADYQRATSPVDAHETANVSDKPEGQQEPVAWASVKDHLPEVGSKFVLLYDDGSGASLYFRHDSGYINAGGDECDALDENRMWAYLPAGFEFWCEGASEPVTLPKWKGPSNPRLSALEATPAPEQRELSAEDVAAFDRALLRSGRKAEATPPAPKVTEGVINELRWIMQNLPIDFVMHERCPVDTLMHVIGTLTAAQEAGKP